MTLFLWAYLRLRRILRRIGRCDVACAFAPLEAVRALASKLKHRHKVSLARDGLISRATIGHGKPRPGASKGKGRPLPQGNAKWSWQRGPSARFNFAAGLAARAPYCETVAASVTVRKPGSTAVMSWAPIRLNCDPAVCRRHFSEAFEEIISHVSTQNWKD